MKNCKERGCTERGGKMRRGRPKMRWEECVKRDLERGKKRIIEKSNKRYNELKTGDREHSERKVRRKERKENTKKTRQINMHAWPTSPMTTWAREEQQFFATKLEDFSRVVIPVFCCCCIEHFRSRTAVASE